MGAVLFLYDAARLTAQDSGGRRQNIDRPKVAFRWKWLLQCEVL